MSGRPGRYRRPSFIRVSRAAIRLLDVSASLAEASCNGIAPRRRKHATLSTHSCVAGSPDGTCFTHADP